MNIKEYFIKRKERKARIVEEVKVVKEEQRIAKEDLKKLPIEKQKKIKKEEKELKKIAKKERKQELKALPRKERRKIKKEQKIFKKVYNRKRRAISWSIVGVVLVLIVVQFGPLVSDITHAISGKDLDIDTTSSAAIAAREHGESVSKEIVNEGIILLKNEEDNLPLQKSDKINVFGISAHNFRYGGGGSGTTSSIHAVPFFDALDNAGIDYNKTLAEYYEGLTSSSNEGVGIIQVVQGFLGMNTIEEPEIDHLTDEVLEQAKSYSKDALIVITSSGSEASDFTPEQLTLSQNKRDLIEKVTENFENVTIVINAGNAIELGFLDEYPSIKSTVWIGTPGPFGTTSLANILNGTINPSGRTTDTYAYDSQSSAASQNFGDYKYDNLDKAFIVYQEGIYVGYRYYESYFMGDETGYQEAVQYPFGYGLSYTDFEWIPSNYRVEEDTILVDVEIKNVGTMAGKEVVQLYYSAPFYEGGLEKSAIELGDYEKTNVLEPNTSQLLTLEIPIRDMASYDEKTEEAYVLDAGNYEIKIGHNVHDISDSYTYTLESKVVYKEDADTNVTYENQFEYAHGDYTYLSRSDWERTYPQDEHSVEAPQSVIDIIKDTSIPEMSTDDLIFNADNGILLEDLKGKSIDDPLWKDYIDQFSADELMHLVTHGAYKTDAIERLGVPKTVLMDGPAGFSYFFGSFDTAGYPSELLIATTWNKDLAYKMGEAIGIEANAYGIQGWYAPAMNLHRTAQGGRNFEYFSEDPLISGNVGTAMTQGAQDKGLLVFMKHFVMNDQETNARSGIIVWSNEQAMRELYLKPFEMTVKDTNIHGAMSSFSYLGPVWAGANPDLLNNVLRKEWGFEGVVSSDAVFGFMKVEEAIINGNDLMLDIMSNTTQQRNLKKAFQENPQYIGTGLKESAHNILFAILQTNIFD